MPVTDASVPEQLWNDAQLLWDYHRMHHEPRPCAVAIGLGSHDLGVATHAAKLYQAGLFPLIVFSGSNSPTTNARFPRGEAVHYREHALSLGVPDEAILVEPKARNTGENVTLSRDVLRGAGIDVSSVMLISKPYEERRSYATLQKLWPDVEGVCASEPLSFSDYVASIGNGRLVIDMLVGTLQRILKYPNCGFTVAQDVPADVQTAYERLCVAGFVSRLLAAETAA